MALKEEGRAYEHPLYTALEAPGLSVAVGSLDTLLSWGTRNSLWVFPMATSCCGIELMAAAGARVDLDRMGTIIRGTPRQTDVMVVAGTITVKMAPRVRKLWDQIPEPKWCIAMGSCAISGDFYRNVYSVVPGIDTVVPVDVYIPGCPPNPEALMQGLLELQKKVGRAREAPAAAGPETAKLGPHASRRVGDPARDPGLDAAQLAAAADPGDTAGTFAGSAPPGWSPEPAPLPAGRPVADLEALLASFGSPDLPKDGPPLVDAARVRDVARAVKAAGYSLLSFIAATHWPAPAAKPGTEPPPPPAEDTYEVAYGARRPGPGAALASWRVRVPAS